MTDECPLLAAWPITGIFCVLVLLLCAGYQPVKVALIQPVLNDAVLLKFAFSKGLCNGGGDFALVGNLCKICTSRIIGVSPPHTRGVRKDHCESLCGKVRVPAHRLRCDRSGANPGRCGIRESPHNPRKARGRGAFQAAFRRWQVFQSQRQAALFSGRVLLQACSPS